MYYYQLATQLLPTYKPKPFAVVRHQRSLLIPTHKKILSSFQGSQTFWVFFFASFLLPTFLTGDNNIAFHATSSSSHVMCCQFQTHTSFTHSANCSEPKPTLKKIIRHQVPNSVLALKSRFYCLMQKPENLQMIFSVRIYFTSPKPTKVIYQAV